MATLDCINLNKEYDKARSWVEKVTKEIEDTAAAVTTAAQETDGNNLPPPAPL